MSHVGLSVDGTGEALGDGIASDVRADQGVSAARACVGDEVLDDLAADSATADGPIDDQVRYPYDMGVVATLVDLAEREADHGVAITYDRGPTLAVGGGVAKPLIQLGPDQLPIISH